MGDLLLKKLSADDYNSANYVQELSQNSVGGLNLMQERQKVKLLSEETNTQLKKNVYMNYLQFIETAKEISYLESEMYQLSHLITEQKSLLSSLLEISVSDSQRSGISLQDIAEVNADGIKSIRKEENRHKLALLLEKVEGCSHILEDPYRYLLFDGDLVELNQDDYTGTQRVHAYLMNDSLMLATWLSDRRGPVRFKFEILHLLDQILPVNIKDRGSTKNTFKVLIFPDSRVFQAPTSKAKQDWLDEIERAKNNKMAADKVKAEEIHKERQASISKDDSLDTFSGDDDDSHNPFIVEVSGLPIGPPEWVQELPEDLDQATAQRNFEDAVELVDRGGEFFRVSPSNPALLQMKRALDSRIKVLVDVLLAELRVTPEKSLQGGPRAPRQAVKLLVHLGYSIKACDLFLKYRNAILKENLKRVRLEGNTSLYVQQLCSLCFRTLKETTIEFKKAFPDSPHCISAFVVSIDDEMKNFAVVFTQHVFTTQTSLSTVSECIALADEHCSALTDVGLDLKFSLHSHLLNDVLKWIKDGQDKMVEAVKLRAQEDSWKNLTFDNKEARDRFLDATDIPNLKSFILDNNRVSLSNNLIQFSKAFLSYLDDVLRLNWPETCNMINESITTIFSAELRHCRNSLDDPLFIQQIGQIQKNSCFLLDVVLSIAEHRYTEVVHKAHPVLHTFHALRPSFDVKQKNDGEFI